MMLNLIHEARQSDLGHIVTLQLTDHSAHELAEWCEAHNVPCMHPEHFHLSLIQTDQACAPLLQLDNTPCMFEATCVGWKQLGERALVLEVSCAPIQHMHERLLEAGATHKYADFIPHVSVNYEHKAYHALPSQVPALRLQFDCVKVEQVDPHFAQRSVK